MMKTLVIYNKDTKNELFNRSDVLDYEVSNYKESTDIEVRLADGTEHNIKLKNDSNFAILINR